MATSEKLLSKAKDHMVPLGAQDGKKTSPSKPPAIAPDLFPVDRGYFTESDHEMDVEIESEDSTDYARGYYYPVCIGDIFENRYQVFHKLGSGGFSTVWLAHDRASGKDVALKVSGWIENPGDADKEYKIHLDIANRIRDCSRLVLCQDKFVLSRMRNNIKRIHTVLVLPLRGPNLLTLQEEGGMPLAYRMSAAKQLLHAIASIHDAGLVHRDIVPRNVVCGLNVDLGKMTVANKYNLLRKPRKASALREGGRVVGELVVPAKFPPKVLGSDFYLCDFGILIRAGDKVNTKLASPPEYCAPELFHNFQPSWASDMWSYMVVFLYLYTGKQAFSGRGYTGMLESIVEHVGQLPDEWKGKYTQGQNEAAKDAWYGRDSQWKNMFGAFINQHRPGVSPKERALTLAVVRQVFQPDPKDRVKASDLLEDKNFNDLMDIYGV